MSALAPYPGLRPFERDEAEVFFGRERHTDELLFRLERTRFLAVVGPSGCGKSSLVRAGLLNALETGFMPSAGVRWHVAQMRPRSQPFMELVAALPRPIALGKETSARSQAEAALALYATLRRGPLGLVEALRENPLPERTNLLLLVDQFEELFRFRAEGDKDEADAFVALLLETSRQDEFPIYVVMTMRTDYLGNCTVFRGLPEAINAGLYLTPRLTRDECRAAIEGPARLFGGAVQGSLVNRLLNEIGTDPDQLPVLQHLLMRMWKRHPRRSGIPAPAEPALARESGLWEITDEDYEKAGGFGAALSRDANEAFERLPSPGEQRVAEVLFRNLCDRDVRRPVTLRDVVRPPRVPRETVRQVIEVFRHPDRSFLTPSAEKPLNDETVIDIGHESLIRQWDRLKAWSQAESNSAEMYRRLVQVARRWEHGHAALWGTPDLEEALEWLKTERPSLGLARRYGDKDHCVEEFRLAMRFLRASKSKKRAEAAAAKAGAEREQEQEREQARRDGMLTQARREAKRRGQLATSLALAAVMAVAAAVFGFLKKWEADQAAVGLAGANSNLQEALDDRNKWLQESKLLEAKLTATNSALAARNQDLQRTTNEKEQARAAAEEEKRKAQESAQEANVQRSQAETNLKRARESEKQVNQGLQQRNLDLFESHLHSASLLAINGEYAQARDALEGTRAEAAELAACNRLSTRNLLFWFVQPMTTAQLAEAQDVHYPLRGLDVTPDCRYLVSFGEDGRTSLFAPANGTAPFAEVRTLTGHTQTVRVGLFSPDGKYLYTGGDDQKIIQRAIRHGETNIWRTPGPVHALAISPDGRFLAGGGADWGPLLWPIPAFVPSDGIELHGATNLTTLSFRINRGSLLLLGGSLGGRVCEWNLGEAFGGGSIRPKPPRILLALPEPVNRLAVLPGGRRLLTAGFDPELRLWDLATGVFERTLRGHKGAILGMALLTQGEHLRLVSASADRTLRIWDLESGVTLQILEGHAALVSGVVVSGGQIFSASNDTTWRRWQPGTGDESRFRLVSLRTPDEAGKLPMSCALAPDLSAVAIGFSNGVVSCRSLETTALLWSERQHADQVNALAFDPGGSRVVSASSDGTSIVWDASTGRVLARLPGHGGRLTSVAFSPNGHSIAAGESSGRAVLRSGGEIAATELDGVVDVFRAHGLSFGPGVPLRGHRGEVHSVSFGASGRHLFSTGQDGQTLAWEVDHLEGGPRALTPLTQPRNIPAGSTASPTNNLVAVFGRTGTITVADLDGQGSVTNTPSLKLVGHENTVVKARFSPDAAHLLSLSTDGTLRAWDLRAPGGARELFALRLPVSPDVAYGLRDFAFGVAPQGTGTIVVPLVTEHLLVYALGPAPIYYTALDQPASPTVSTETATSR